MNGGGITRTIRETYERSFERGDRGEDTRRETTEIGAETSENDIWKARKAQKRDTETGGLRGPQKRDGTE